MFVVTLSRVVAAVNAAVVVIPVLAIHLVAVEFDAAIANIDIQAVVLPPVVLFVIPVEIDLDVIAGDVDAVGSLGGGRSKSRALHYEQGEQQCAAVNRGVALEWIHGKNTPVVTGYSAG